MRLEPLTVLATTLAAIACASSGQGDVADGENTVQLTVINEFQGTVTAYAHWDGTRIRLGDVPQNRTRLFMTPVRSNRVAIGLEAIGAPPAGTTAGPTRFRGGGDPDPSAPYAASEATPVVPGDALEFRLSAAGVLTVRRLEIGS